MRVRYKYLIKPLPSYQDAKDVKELTANAE